jgi:hypothetical protein
MFPAPIRSRRGRYREKVFGLSENLLTQDPTHLMRNGTVDLVFANEAELGSLYETANFDAALNASRPTDRFAAAH